MKKYNVILTILLAQTITLFCKEVGQREQEIENENEQEGRDEIVEQKIKHKLLEKQKQFMNFIDREMTQKEKPVLLRLLNDFDIDLNFQDENGDTPLMYAVLNHNTSLFDLLLDKNVALDMKNNAGNTALILAVQERYFHGVKYLIKAGANIAIRDESNQTAMDYANDPAMISFFNTLVSVNSQAVSQKRGRFTHKNIKRTRHEDPAHED